MAQQLLITILIFVLGTFIGLNVLTKNFIATYLQVRFYRENGVLILVFGKRGLYFKPGKIKEDTVTFNYARKQKATLKTEKTYFWRALGVNFFMLEEGSDRTINNIKFEGGKGAEPVKYDELLVRSLYKPTITSAKDNLLIILIVAALAVSLYTAWKVGSLETVIQSINTISGGNI